MLSGDIIFDNDFKLHILVSENRNYVKKVSVEYFDTFLTMYCPRIQLICILDLNGII